MYKIAIVGHFADGVDLANGQTVKTKNLHRALAEQYHTDRIFKVDTYGFQRHIFSFFVQCIRAIMQSKNVIILPAQNGVKVFLPLFAICNVLFGRKLHYAVIGGWLPEFLDQHKWLRFFAKRFDGIYVETSHMQSALKRRGFSNAAIMPNFKFITPLTEDELVYPTGEPYRLCTFSRVMKEKGIEDALKAVKMVNEKLGRTVYALDIYGQVDENQTEWFDNLQKDFPTYVRYCGVIPPEESVQTLKDYFVLLFLTYYSGEGFAGTLLDAYAAGVPVIASDWRYNAEIVKNEGFLLPTRDIFTLVDLLISCAEQSNLILDKKANCLVTAQEFSPANAIECLLKRVD